MAGNQMQELESLKRQNDQIRRQYNRVNDELQDMIYQKMENDQELNRMNLKIQSDKNIMKIKQSEGLFKLENQLRETQLREKKYLDETKHYKQLYKDLTEKFNDRQSQMVTENIKENDELKKEIDQLKGKLKEVEFEKSSYTDKLNMFKNQMQNTEQKLMYLQKENQILKENLGNKNGVNAFTWNKVLGELNETKNMLELYKQKNSEKQNELNKLLQENNYIKSASKGNKNYFSIQSTPNKNLNHVDYRQGSNSFGIEERFQQVPSQKLLDQSLSNFEINSQLQKFKENLYNENKQLNYEPISNNNPNLFEASDTHFDSKRKISTNMMNIPPKYKPSEMQFNQFDNNPNPNFEQIQNHQFASPKLHNDSLQTKQSYQIKESNVSSISHNNAPIIQPPPTQDFLINSIENGSLSRPTNNYESEYFMKNNFK